MNSFQLFNILQPYAMKHEIVIKVKRKRTYKWFPSLTPWRQINLFHAVSPFHYLLTFQHHVFETRPREIWKVTRENNEKRASLTSHRHVESFIFDSILWLLVFLIVVTVKAHKKPKSTHINSFHVITMRWWVLFTVPRRRRKTITRKKNNNHKMNEKCSVGSSREVILPDIFASSSHTAGDCDHPKNYVHPITWQRYESRLVKSKNEIKFERLIYFQ